jgi:hypothetical protein
MSEFNENTALGIPSTNAQDKFHVNPFLFRKD